MYSRFPILHKATVFFMKYSVVHGPYKELVSYIEYKVLGNGFFGHPEVKKIGFLTLLYAGTTIYIWNTPFFMEVVTKSKFSGQSAGNERYNQVGTSENLCKET